MGKKTVETGDCEGEHFCSYLTCHLYGHYVRDLLHVTAFNSLTRSLWNGLWVQLQRTGSAY